MKDIIQQKYEEARAQGIACDSTLVVASLLEVDSTTAAKIIDRLEDEGAYAHPNEMCRPDEAGMRREELRLLRLAERRFDEAVKLAKDAADGDFFAAFVLTEAYFGLGRWRLAAETAARALRLPDLHEGFACRLRSLRDAARILERDMPILVDSTESEVTK